MILQIVKGSSLKSVQKQFNACYPFLKVEFFKKIPVNQPIYKAEVIVGIESAKLLDSSCEGKQVDISGTRTVLEVENDFEKLFGYPAHVFRKSGNVWVETSLTSDWPLDEQNEEGEEISSHFTNNDKKD